MIDYLTIYKDKTSKEALYMTVATQVKQAVAGLKSVQASFEQFALQTENQQAKLMYQQAAEQAKQILQSVEPRIAEIEMEEPQYKQ